jgi:hypothetical protein
VAEQPPTELVLPDAEMDDGDLTVRPQMFGSGRLVLAIGHGDEETGTSEAVALDPEDEARLLAYLTARAEARR